MDYSQFLAMKQEIGLLIVFLLVFLYDTFMPKKAQSNLPGFTCLFFALFTVACFCPCLLTNAESFSGMYESSAVIVTIKNI